MPGGTNVTCEPRPHSIVDVLVEAHPPLDWSCLTFDDQRLPVGADFPDWYTYYGRTPVRPDEPPDLLGHQIGVLYNATRLTHDEVRGAVQLRTENASVFFTWTGPSAGFVRFPVDLTDPNPWLLGVLYPANWTPAQAEPSGGFHAASDNWTIDDVAPVWTVGKVGDGGPAPNPEDLTFRAVMRVSHSATPYFSLASPTGIAIRDPRPYPGMAHWEMGRMHPYNATMDDGLHHFASSLQPFMTFDAEFRDVNNPLYISSSRSLCACPPALTPTVEGALCFLGFPPPSTRGTEGRFVTSVASPSPDATWAAAVWPRGGGPQTP